MGYVIDRQRAFRQTELVAVVSVRRRGVRSQVLLEDGSLYDTLTRPRTFKRNLERSYGKAVSQI